MGYNALNALRDILVIKNMRIKKQCFALICIYVCKKSRVMKFEASESQNTTFKRWFS